MRETLSGRAEVKIGKDNKDENVRKKRYWSEVEIEDNAKVKD